MGTLQFSTLHYVMITYTNRFISPDLRSSKPFLSGVILTRETTTTMTTTEKNWPGDEVKHELFGSLKANSLKTGIKHLNDRLCFLVQ